MADEAVGGREPSPQPARDEAMRARRALERSPRGGWLAKNNARQLLDISSATYPFRVEISEMVRYICAVEGRWSPQI